MMNLRKECREEIRNDDSLNDALIHFSDTIELLSKFDFYRMIQSIEKGESIGYTGAFLGFLHVVWANNARVKNRLFPNLSQENLTKKAVIFLMTMRFQEERGNITGEEIAGMVAATRLDFTFLVGSPHPIAETCGMGGDIGFWVTDFDRIYKPLGDRIQQGFKNEALNMSEDGYYGFIMNDVIVPDRAIKQSYKSKNKKSVNISTLSSFLLGSMGHTTMKHGSGKNTTAVWSTDAAVKFGVPIIFKDSTEPQDIMDNNDFVYTDAGVSKTIHDISGSVLQTETVNHLIGPMTPPIDRHTELNKILGINHNVSFRVLWKAYETIHEKKVYDIGDVIIVGGYENMPNSITDDIHKGIRLDEFSPKWSVLGILIDGKYQGEFLISEKDFWIRIDMDKILLEWSEDVINSMNEMVLLNDAPEDIIDLVCCNAALGILVASGRMREPDFIVDGKVNPTYLRVCYEEARKQISTLRVNKYMDMIRLRISGICKTAA